MTINKLIDELKSIGCEIDKDRISISYRMFRKHATNAPGVIFASFISQQDRDYVLSFRDTYRNAEQGKYINEDMTLLQRKLFNYLRTKEDILLKKSVGFRDGRIVFILKKNINGTDKQWSRIENATDLNIVTHGIEMDYNDQGLLETLGLQDCKVSFANV